MAKKKSKHNAKDKLTKIGTAALGGAAGGVILKAVADFKPSGGGQPLDSKLVAAAPLAAAYFLYDYNPELALGMAGSGGQALGKEFGIGDIGEDDIDGLDFQEIDDTQNVGESPLMGLDEEEEED